MVHHRRGPRRGQNHFLESTQDRRIKDREECRKVDVIEEEMEESQTDSHHVTYYWSLKVINERAMTNNW